jgi:Fe2+ transport system protein B
MGARVFNNDFFDLWLGKETDRILNKIDKETITSDEMILLILKAQTNHFAHMDQDIKGELAAQKSAVNQRFDEVNQQFEEQRIEVNQRFAEQKIEVNKRFEEQKIEVNKRFDTLGTEIRWGFGLCFGMFASLFIKLIAFS